MYAGGQCSCASLRVSQVGWQGSEGDNAALLGSWREVVNMAGDRATCR